MDLVSWWRGSEPESPHPTWVRVTMRVVLAVGWALLLASVLVRSLGHPSLPLMIAGAACFAVVWLLFLVGLFVGPGNRY